MQLCTALEYLHTRQPPIVFRDLKPGNIIRSPGGKLSLIDFGIARHFRPGQARDTQPLGSPGYAAPEQYGRAQTTPQTDIYSLGALLHGLLSGQDPSEQLHGLAPLRVDQQPELATLIQRMLSADPAARPANVQEVAAALTAIRQARTAADAHRIWLPPTPQLYPATAAGQQHIHLQSSARKRLTSRRKALIGIGVSVLALTVAGGAFWTMNNSQAVSQSVSPHQNTDQSGDPAISPVNASIIYQGHTGIVNSVAWSFNGEHIASASDDRTVQAGTRHLEKRSIPIKGIQQG